jgi:DNA-binding transcriptional ArsR family regulator
MSQHIEARYAIYDAPAPLKSDRESDLEWICRCFGFLESRDKMKTAARIFAALVEAPREKGGISSDELAEKVGVSRAAVVHHLNKMTGSGLVIRREGLYRLREQNLENTVIEIQRDVARIFENLRRIAREIDESMNMPRRENPFQDLR